MRVIEHDHIFRQPPANATPTVHFPPCSIGTPASGPTPRRPEDPLLHYSITPFLIDCQRTRATSHIREAIKSLRSRFCRASDPENFRGCSFLLLPPKFYH